MTPSLSTALLALVAVGIIAALWVGFEFAGVGKALDAIEGKLRELAARLTGRRK